MTRKLFSATAMLCLAVPCLAQNAVRSHSAGPAVRQTVALGKMSAISVTSLPNAPGVGPVRLPTTKTSRNWSGFVVNRFPNILELLNADSPQPYLFASGAWLNENGATQDLNFGDRITSPQSDPGSPLGRQM